MGLDSGTIQETGQPGKRHFQQAARLPRATEGVCGRGAQSLLRSFLHDKHKDREAIDEVQLVRVERGVVEVAAEVGVAVFVELDGAVFHAGVDRFPEADEIAHSCL
jgi:hypothetical protein